MLRSAAQRSVVFDGKGSSMLIEGNPNQFINWYKGLDYKNITVLLDENGEIIKRANVLGYPFNLLLDKDLNLIKAQPGHLNSDQIKQFVKE